MLTDMHRADATIACDREGVINCRNKISLFELKHFNPTEHREWSYSIKKILLIVHRKSKHFFQLQLIRMYVFASYFIAKNDWASKILRNEEIFNNGHLRLALCVKSKGKSTVTWSHLLMALKKIPQSHNDFQYEFGRILIAPQDYVKWSPILAYFFSQLGFTICTLIAYSTNIIGKSRHHARSSNRVAPNWKQFTFQLQLILISHVFVEGSAQKNSINVWRQLAIIQLLSLSYFVRCVN